VPLIAFPRGAGAGYSSYAAAVGAAGISLDTSVSLAWACDALPGVCLQGNLDPVALMVGGASLRAETEHILRTLAGRPHIFNLGHGVLPPTDPDHVGQLIELVRGGPR
jgi:uroporphyrinogen decarboxylase